MYLVADIGATNARFQLVQGPDQPAAQQPVILVTQDFDRCEDLVQAAVEALDLTGCSGALFAVAGPSDQANTITLTNTGLVIDAVAVQEVLQCAVVLLNDFVALAHGIPHFEQVVRIGGQAPAEQTKALLGPGSGLGMATIVPVNQQPDDPLRWHVLASEGGHADLAPGNHLEAELWGVLSAQHAHVCWETVLCGPGLQHLYAAMCSLWGGRPESLSPAQIVEQGLSMSDPVCHQTLETFCGMLGAAAGNLALTVAATGGVYIGGGIVPRMLEFVGTSPLRRRFEERGDLTDLVKDIPLLVITEEHAGLRGATAALRAHAYKLT